jgi:hypothetical protein
MVCNAKPLFPYLPTIFYLRRKVKNEISKVSYKWVPDFSWCNIPKRGKIYTKYQMTVQLDQMGIKYVYHMTVKLDQMP